MNFENVKYEWNVVSTDSFSITIVAWHLKEHEWKWNAYVYLSENHELFAEPQTAIDNIPFHGGCSYDQYITMIPSLGIRYSWQKSHTVLKLGCDYNHYGDEYYSGCAPEYGVPFTIQDDVKRIYEYLKGDNDDGN